MVTPRRFSLVFLVLAGLLGLTVSPASAATARTLSIKVSSTTPSTSATVTFSGTLSKSPRGTTVKVARKSGTRWVTVKSTRTTTTKGAYKVALKVPSSAARHTYRATAARTSRLKAATSRTLVLDVRSKVGITSTLSPTTVAAGSTTVLSGTVSPASVGTAVTIQRVAGSTVTTITTTTQKSTGSYSATITPPSAGTFTYRASTAARTGYTAAVSPSRSVTVQPVPVAPVISTTSLPAGVVNQPYDATLATVGGQPGTWSVSPALPGGLSLNGSSGRLSGTAGPVSTGRYTFTFRHANGLVTSRALVLGVYVRPQITTSSLPVTSPGSTYPFQLQASEAGTWKLIDGTALPAGVTMSPAGLLSGTVAAPLGSTAFSVRFTSSASGLTSDAAFQIEVKDYIATKTLPVAAAGQPYSFVLRTNGNIAGTWTSLGGLPGGISLDGARLSGTPQAGTSTTLFLTFTPRQPYAAADTRLVYTVEGTMPSTRSSTVVDAGSQFACRVKSEDASLWCWGYNLSGNLGIGDYSPMDAVQPTPQKVPGAWRTVATGGFFGACGLRTDDSLWCWGQSNQGQIGDGSLVGANSPRQVTSGGKTWSSVAVGYSHACATTKPGALWCWGDNSSGALGLPAAGNGSSTPVLVDQSTWTAVSAGNNQTCGVKTDGSLWCWGQGDRTPVKVDSATWSDVTIGLGSICGVRTDGTLWCWGSNRRGQLGNGTTAASASPTQVGSAVTWRSVSSDGGSSGATTCGTQTDGSGWCWGAGEDGQLGNGTAQSSLLPVRIDPTSTWSSVAVGDAFVCGVKNDGTQRCWGSGDSGQLGAGAPRRSDVPITVQ